jgi:CRP-like cAMP-binding protein
MENIKERLLKMNTSTPQAVQVLMKLGMEQNFKKGTIISSPQHSFPILYFIEDGLVRGFSEFDGKENTFWVLQSGFILPSKGYFINREFPEYVQFLSDTKTWSLNLLKSAKPAIHQPILYQMLLEINETSYFEARDRELFLRLSEARERYLWLKRKNPSLIYLLKKEILASLLNMSTKHLSRIKSEDAHKR